MQTRGARVDGEMRLKRERETIRIEEKEILQAERKRQKAHSLIRGGRERRKAKEGRFKRGSRRDGVTS